MYTQSQKEILLQCWNCYPDFLRSENPCCSHAEYIRDKAYLVEKGVVLAQDFSSNCIGGDSHFSYGQPRLSAEGVEYLKKEGLI